MEKNIKDIIEKNAKNIMEKNIKEFELKTNNILIIKDNKIKYISLSLLIFYLTISTNFIGELYNKELLVLLKNNYTLKHILGFLTLITGIVVVTNDGDFWEIIKISSIIYILFLMSTKISPKYMFSSLILILIIYLINKIKSKNLSIQKKKELNNLEIFLSICAIIIIIYRFIFTYYIYINKYKYINIIKYMFVEKT